MTDPLRSDTAAETAEVPERDRDARIEELLLSGLDHYFKGQHELAINVWTRVLFLDRGHAKARAYIERARSAVSERHREGEELIHAGSAALQHGDVKAARRLLTSALERGVSNEETFALLERLDRLEAAAVHHDGPGQALELPVLRRGRPVVQPASRTRLRWIGAGALLGMSAAVAIMVWVRGDTWRPLDGTAERPAAASLRAEDPLPVPAPAEISLQRARALYEKGRLHEALPLLDEVQHGDPLRPRADELRARIQRHLLDARPRRSGPTPPSGAAGQ